MILAITGLTLTVLPNAALAQNSKIKNLRAPKSYFAASLGYFNALDAEDNAADIRLEYHSNISLLWNIQPWLGLEITNHASLWAGGGFERTFYLTESLFLTPSLGAGYYAKGSSDLDLDFPLQFRSQILLGYQTEQQHRLGLAFSHTSNASLSDENPGTEAISFYYMLPLN